MSNIFQNTPASCSCRHCGVLNLQTSTQRSFWKECVLKHRGQEITAKFGEIFINDASVAMFTLKFGELIYFKLTLYIYTGLHLFFCSLPSHLYYSLD